MNKCLSLCVCDADLNVCGCFGWIGSGTSEAAHEHITIILALSRHLDSMEAILSDFWQPSTDAWVPRENGNQPHDAPRREVELWFSTRAGWRCRVLTLRLCRGPSLPKETGRRTGSVKNRRVLWLRLLLHSSQPINICYFTEASESVKPSLRGF